MAVIGTGLIGGSIALGLRQNGIDARTWDSSEEVRGLARRAGLNVFDEVASTVDDADVVVVATPPGDVIETAKLVLELGGHAVVTDVASTKAGIADQLVDHYAKRARRFVPSHPMAGKAKRGFVEADAHLFQGCTWVICDDADEATSHIQNLAVALGAGRVVNRSPRQHDEQVAVISHLPQLLVTATAANFSLEQSRSFRNQPDVQEALRLAHSPAEMWLQIAQTNRTAISQAIEDALRLAPLSTTPNYDERENVNGRAVVTAMAQALYNVASSREVGDPGTLELAGPGFRSATSARDIAVDKDSLNAALVTVASTLGTLNRNLSNLGELEHHFLTANNMAREIFDSSWNSALSQP